MDVILDVSYVGAMLLFLGISGALAAGCARLGGKR